MKTILIACDVCEEIINNKNLDDIIINEKTDYHVIYNKTTNFSYGGFSYIKRKDPTAMDTVRGDDIFLDYKDLCESCIDNIITYIETTKQNFLKKKYNGKN